MGLPSLETSKIQPLLWGRPGPSVLTGPTVPIQDNSSDSQPALPQRAATYTSSISVCDPSHGLHSWVILLDCRHPHSPAAPDHYGPAVGTLIAQVLLFLESPGNLARDHPMLRGACIPMPQRTLRSLVIHVFVPGYSQALCPSWPHSPGLPTSLGHQWLCSMYQCSSQVPSCPRSSPSTSIITFPCSQGNPDPSCMVHT